MRSPRRDLAALLGPDRKEAAEPVSVMIRVSTLVVCCLLFLGCGRQSDPAGSAGGSREGAPTDSGGAPRQTGRLTGVIRFEGEAPERKILDMSQRKQCASLHADGPRPRSEKLVVNPGDTLRDVIVIVEGVGGRHRPPAEPVVLDQERCMYKPHVFAIMTGQPLTLRNSDGFLHNVNCDAGGFNHSMTDKGQEIREKGFRRTGPVQFRCSIHSWMQAWAYVVDHPYHDVTGGDGTFSIENIPPGEYTLRVWHERVRGLATPRSVPVLIRSGETTTRDLTFVMK